MPVVVDDGDGRLCILIKELPDDLARYLADGTADTKRFHVFTKEQEGGLASLCSREGLTITYRSHSIQYMHKVATIIYPQISCPAADTKVLLLPWFMQVDRPYPIFANIYGCWHYLESGRKSMQESADAVARVFGIKSFNKSTISRNLKEIDRIYRGARIDAPLCAEERETPQFADIAALVPKLLKASQASAANGGTHGEAASPVPGGGRGTDRGSGEAARAALGAIPRRLSEVILQRGGEPQGRRDARKRARRLRRAIPKKERPAPPFAKPQAIDQARREFIAACRDMAMDAAVKYHSALI
ncbi:MAG: hypothetical protein FWH26_11260 [Oscillospiraceae bacterium]|nr:hypothetical protein [Oscillospiraceae bacterium]